MVIQSTGTAQATSLRARFRALVCIALPAFVLAACAAPSYYFQAASGQWELLHQRQDIDELLANPSTDPELARRLNLAREIRAFGVSELGLPAGDSYTGYTATGREAVTWNVIAAPEFSLRAKTWCFMVAGCVPYRGYFEQERADRFAGKLRHRGYDVVVAPATAYSTLGWFDDPLLDTMFLDGDTALAGTILHEMAHLQLYVKGDTAFNESFAMFVEDTGLRRWLLSRGDEIQQRARAESRRASRDLDELYGRYRAELENLYAGSLAKEDMRTARKQVFDRLCQAVRERTTDSGPPANPDCGFNNASLALHSSYHGGVCAFEQLYRETGADMAVFLEQAAAVAQQPSESRRKWLEQPCPPVAREGNL